MVNTVPSPIVAGVVTLPRTFALCVAGVVTDESGAADQQVKQEAEHLHADGHQEENERVPSLVADQQLGEDARQGDDDPCCAWVRTEQRDTEGMRGMRRATAAACTCTSMCARTYSLQSSPPVCTSWAASPCNHRNWTAALGRDEEVVIGVWQSTLREQDLFGGCAA